jgi:hypothetical protein
VLSRPVGTGLEAKFGRKPAQNRPKAKYKLEFEVLSLSESKRSNHYLSTFSVVVHILHGERGRCKSKQLSYLVHQAPYSACCVEDSAAMRPASQKPWPRPSCKCVCRRQLYPPVRLNHRHNSNRSPNPPIWDFLDLHNIGGAPQKAATELKIQNIP